MRQACRLLLLALPQGTQLGGGLGQLKLRQRRGGVRQRLAGLLLPGGGLLLLLCFALFTVIEKLPGRDVKTD